MTTKLRLASLLAVLAIAAIAFGATTLTQRGATDDVGAASIVGEYSLAVTAPPVVAVGTSFTAKVEVTHLFPKVPCTDGLTNGLDDDGDTLFDEADEADAGTPFIIPAAGCYKAVGHNISYNSTIISSSLAGITRDAGAQPASQCTTYAEAISEIGAGSSIKGGCLSTTGPILSYSGNYVNIVYTCLTAGTSPLFILKPDPDTLVNDGITDLLFHVHGSNSQPAVAPYPANTVTCVNTADAVAVKTGPGTVNAGAALLYTVVSTNTGPSVQIGGIVADDLDDATDTSGCIPGPGTNCAVLSIDADGDAVYETVNPLGCIYLPAFANPFFPVGPALAIKLIICPASTTIGAGPIAVGGSMKLTTVAPLRTLGTSCGDPLADRGIGTSDSPSTPSFGVPGVNVDPDFLDGFQLADDNFSDYAHAVGGCPLSIVKNAPAQVTQGNAFAYTLSVTNAGPSQATSVVLTDTAPLGTTVTSVVGTGCGFVGNLVTCNIGTMLALAVENITINVTADTPSTVCNSATVTWVQGPLNNGTASDLNNCTVIAPPFSQANGIFKDCDPSTPIDPLSLTLVSDPASAGAEQECNLWICVDASSDGLDNNGDSTVDNEPNTCPDDLLISEYIVVRPDCDTHNDDDDGDGKPVATKNDDNDLLLDEDQRDGVDDDGDGKDGEDPYGVLVPLDYTVGSLPSLITNGNGTFGEISAFPSTATYEFERCRPPTPLEIINNLLDKTGGEVQEGLGAFEFQIKFDHKIFDLEVVATSFLGGSGNTVNCTMTIITENDIRFGCVTTPVFDPTQAEDNGAPGTCFDNIDQGAPANADGADQADFNDCYNSGLTGTGVISGIAATIRVTPEADLIYRIRPTKDNGVVRMLLDENCEVADLLGDIFPITNAGLTPQCEHVTLTVRRLEGDVNADCEVDVNDAQLIAFRYGSFFGHLSYDQNYDMEPWPTADFDIDIKDLQFVFGRVGSTCENPIPDQQNPQGPGGVGQP